MSEKRYNDLKTEAKRLGVSPRTLERRCKDGQFPFIRLGHLVRFDPELSDRHLASLVFNGRAAELAQIAA